METLLLHPLSCADSRCHLPAESGVLYCARAGHEDTGFLYSSDSPGGQLEKFSIVDNAERVPCHGLGSWYAVLYDHHMECHADPF